jgi:hypothetical protein
VATGIAANTGGTTGYILLQHGYTSVSVPPSGKNVREKIGPTAIF